MLGLSSRLVGGLFGATAGGGSGAVGSPSSGPASLADDHTVGCVCAEMLVEIRLLFKAPHKEVVGETVVCGWPVVSIGVG